jgi:hypothetical protein
MGVQLMITSILIGIGVFFYFLSLLGLYGNIFLMFGIGLTGAGLSLVLSSITMKNNWDGFKWRQKNPNLRIIMVWFQRLLFLGLGFLSLYGASSYWLDLPSYINKNYSHLEGIPTKITYEEPSGHEVEGTIFVTIKNKTLSLDTLSNNPVKHMEGHRFEINYLPHTKWIINYKIYSNGK